MLNFILNIEIGKVSSHMYVYITGIGLLFGFIHSVELVECINYK